MKPHHKTGSTPSKSKWVLLAGLLVFAAALGGAVYAYAQMRVDPEVARLQQKSQELFQPPAAAAAPPSPEEEENRRQQFEEFRSEVEQLDESQRQQLFQGFREQMQQHMREEITQFYELPADEQTAFLDERIDRMEAMRERWSQRQASEGGPPGPPEGPPPGGPPPGGPPPGAGGPPGPPGEAGSLDPERRQERREQFRRQFLADTTPEERAQMADFMERIEQRREERGLPAMRGPGPP